MSEISLAAWQAGGRAFNYRGHRIFWQTAGDEGKPVLLLIHGFPTASWDWEALWPALSQHYRLLTLDMIGFGFSAKPHAYDYSILDQADLFEAFLRRQGVGRYHILAHDYGDTVAQELLARQGEEGHRPQVLSVGLLNGGLFPETHRAVLTQKLLLSPLGPLVGRLGNKERLARTMSSIFGPRTPPSAAVIDSFWQLMSTNNGSRIMHKLIRYIPERRRHRERWVGALQQSTVPLKLIDGAMDPVSGAHMVARYRELVPNPDVTLLEEIGHYPQVEAPAAVLEAYLEFRARAL